MTKAEYEALIDQAVRGQIMSMFGVLVLGLIAGDAHAEDNFQRGLSYLQRAADVAFSKGPAE